MTSLRQRLLLSLWLTLALVGSITAVFTYFQARGETNARLDYQMEQIASLVGAHSYSGSAAEVISPRISIDHDIEDDFMVDIYDVSGKLLYASRSSLLGLTPDWRGFRTINAGGADYRVFSADSKNQRIVVAQQMELRRETAANAAFMALLPVIVLIPVLGVVISFVIRRQLQPLSTTALEVAARPPLALDPLPVAGLPAEVLPLINEINRLLVRLHDASEREQRFIADAAHALRTPLAALQLQADVLDGSPDATERTARTAELRAGIRRAVRLANDLLVLARSEHAAGPVHSQIAFGAAVTEAYELYASIASTRGVRLRLNACSGATVPGDARQLAQITANLLDNALRYTPPGGCVAISALADAGGARIEVIDEGPGLPESELEKVFERFYRAPGDATEGSGLGLAVVRGIAESLGGRVWLENRSERRGLIVHVWLPRVINASPDAAIKQSSCA